MRVPWLRQIASLESTGRNFVLYGQGRWLRALFWRWGRSGGFLLIVAIVAGQVLAGCGADPTPTVVVEASPMATSAAPGPTATATSLPASSTPTPTGLPTIPASATPGPISTVPPTSTPSPTFAPSDTATATGTDTPPPTPSPQFSPTPVPTTAFTEDIVHVLLIGGDRNYTLDMNTDTLIVVVIDRVTKQVSLLSIPRDLWVHIPTYGWGRINTAHRIGARFKYPEGKGPGLLMRTIEENLGLPIDHWVRINYEGFAQVVDELGGVDVAVACPINLRYKPPESEDEEEMILEPGVHHLDGTTALRYVRTRRSDSDFGRARRQQQFLKAVWDQFKSPDIIPKIPGLWSALEDSYATDLKLGDVLALAPLVLDLQPQRIRSRYIGNGQVEGWTTPEGWHVLVPIPEKVQQVVASLYAPPAGDQNEDNVVRVQVQNGTGRPQLARIAADQLHWQGFKIVDTGLADSADYEQTQIIVLNDKPGAVEKLASLLQVKPKNIIHQPADDTQVDLRIILGADYDPCR